MNLVTRLRDLKSALIIVWQTQPLWMLLLMIGTFALALLPAAGIWVNKLLLDTLVGSVGSNISLSLPGLVFLQAAILSLTGITNTFNATLQELLSARVQEKLSLRLFAHAALLPLETYESPETQDALRNANQEVSGRALSIWVQLLSVLQAVVALTALGGLLLTLGPSLLPLILLATLPSVLVQQIYGTRGLRLILSQTPLLRMQTYLVALLTNERYAKEVRTFGLETYFGDRWKETFRTVRNAQARLAIQRSLGSGAALTFSAFVMGLAAWLVVSRAMNGQLTVGDVSMFLAGSSQVQGRLTSLLGGIVSLTNGLAYLRLLFGFLESPSRHRQGLLEWTEEITSIEFSDVSYTYSRSDRSCIEGLNFTIRRGESLALIGSNGAGKSTLIKLLLGLYQPTTGVIRLNGKDASQYDPASVSMRMTTLLQDHAPYHLKVHDNVILGDIRHPEQPGEVHTALRKAKADFVARFPVGVEQQLGVIFTGGVQLSGGEWQRLALGRALYRTADVLIFDEPGSALDPEAEHLLIESLYSEIRDKILVLVSHRLATVRSATQILRLENGRLAELGNHEQLMKAGGEYARLFKIQSAGYKT